jgi:hypothetical protein
MADKKITELTTASGINASDVSVLVSSGSDYQYSFATLLAFIGSNLSVGAQISFGTALPQNNTGKNGDVFINTNSGQFAQKINGTWTVIYTITAAGAGDGTILYGIGAPGGGTGKDGDTYIDTGSGIFYCKNSGSWSQSFSMQTGPAGAKGAKGDTGATGANGKSLLNGTVNPSNGVGNDGDFYINTANYYLFGPKSAGVWGIGISLAPDTNKAYVDTQDTYYANLAKQPSSITQDSAHRFVTDAEIADWDSKEPAITAGTTGEYWRGDKTWQLLNTDVVPEGLTNLYYTDARVQNYGDARYLQLAGGTLTGDVQQHTSPANGFSLVNANYVNASVSSGIISALNIADTRYLPFTGGTMLGPLYVARDAQNAMEPLTYGQFLNWQNGLNWKHSVRASTQGSLPAYTTSTDFETLTATANGALPAQDGITLIQGDTLLVKNESGAARTNHGAFTVTQLGDSTHTWILTRVADSNTSALLESATYKVREGTVEANRVYSVNVTPIVLGATQITFALTGGPGTYYNGIGISLAGNVFSLDLSYTANSSRTGLLAASDFNTFSSKQSAITLTTTGNSGSATFTSNVLNIPQYTLSGLGGINYASLSATSPLLYNNSTGVFSIQQASGSQPGYLASADFNTFTAKADDTSVVHRTGNITETITGLKTFSPTATIAYDFQVIAANTSDVSNITNPGAHPAYVYGYYTNGKISATGYYGNDGTLLGYATGNTTVFGQSWDVQLLSGVSNVYLLRGGYTPKHTSIRPFAEGYQLQLAPDGGNLVVGGTSKYAMNVGTTFQQTIYPTLNNQTIYGVYINPTFNAGTPITGLSITNAGSGYNNGTFTGIALSPSAGYGSGYGAIVTLVISGGSIQSVTVTNGGTGYTVGDVLPFVATGFTGPGTVKASFTVTSVGTYAGCINAALGLNGAMHLIGQASAPTAPASGTQLIYADTSGRITFMGANGYAASLTKTNLTASRIYSFPDAAGTFGLLENAQTWTGANTYSPTLTFTANNQTLQGVVINPTFNNTGNYTGFTATPLAVYGNGSITGAVISVQNNYATSYSSIDYYGSDGTKRLTSGYANASAQYFTNLTYFNTAGVDFVLAYNQNEKARITTNGLLVGGGTFTGINTKPLLVVQNYAGNGLVGYQNLSNTGYSSFDIYDDSGNLVYTFGHANSGAVSFASNNNYINTNSSSGNGLIFAANSSEAARLTYKLFNVGPANTSIAASQVFSVTSNTTAVSAGTVQNTSATGYSAIDYYDNAGTKQLSFGYANASTSLLAGYSYINTLNNPFAIAVAGAQKVLINSTGLGIGNMATVLNPFHVTPAQYSTGTASQSGTTVTGGGTSWTSAMVGSQFIFANGTNAGIITAVASSTSLTVTTSQTVTSQAYTITYNALHVNSSGQVGIGTSSPVSGLTLGVQQNLATIFNTADQTGTANEKVTIGFGSNIFQILSTAGSTGTVRSFGFGLGAAPGQAAGRFMTFNSGATSSAGIVDFNYSSGLNYPLTTFQGSLGASSGNQTFAGFYVTNGQSGTANFNVLAIYAYPNGSSTGSSYLIKAGTQTGSGPSGGGQTNKFTLDTSGNAVFAGSIKFNLGSDATGDLYYRDSSGNFVRLPIGTSGQTLKVVSGLPAWV